MARKRKELSDFDRLPKRVRSIIERCRSGQKLCKQIRLKDGSESEITFIFEPSGKKAPVKSTAAALSSGFLRPLGDGLFGAETSQTWEAA